MYMLRKLRERSMRPLLEQERKIYKSFSIEEIHKFQLNTFNELWQEIGKKVPFYTDHHELQKPITSFSDLEGFPIITRDFVSANIQSFTSMAKPPEGYGTTGGSTGNPLRFPKWRSEAKFCEPAVWYVRDFYGVTRSDKMFRLWGHSHTLGRGLTRLKNKLIFDIGLPLVGFKRFSAYDLSEDKLRQAGEQIIRFRPAYIIGYSKALFMLAKANEDKRPQFHSLKLKVVLGAAEGFEREEDREFVSDVFGCPVGLQYASMESNYLAQTHPEGGYRALWKNNLIECVDDEGNPAESGRILVTSLYPRAFPLIRYEMGDVIEGCKKIGNSVVAFDAVKGRNNDFLILDDGSPIHSEGITHAIKLLSKVSAYQIRFTPEGVHTVYLVSSASITDKEVKGIQERLMQVDSRLGDLAIKQVSALRQTIAGKTKWLMPE